MPLSRRRFSRSRSDAGSLWDAVHKSPCIVCGLLGSKDCTRTSSHRRTPLRRSTSRQRSTSRLVTSCSRHPSPWLLCAGDLIHAPYLYMNHPHDVDGLIMLSSSTAAPLARASLARASLVPVCISFRPMTADEWSVWCVMLTFVMRLHMLRIEDV